MESSENIPAVPVDQYSMLYKVALPSGTYSSSSLHPVLSHISPAYTVHSPLMQHPGIPYPPLGYAQIPHSQLQFVSPSYAAVPYAVPPGFVHSSILSPSGALSQPHAVSHLVPYPSVMQEGVVSPPSQQQVAAHTFTKVGGSGGIPLMLTSEQAELSARGVPVYYRPQGALAGPEVLRDAHMVQQETQAKMNGGEGREDYKGRTSRLLQVAPGGGALDYGPDRGLKDRRGEDRHSPGQRSTPDSDLELQQAGGPSSGPGHGGGRKEVSFAPLNLSQGSQRAREAHGDPTPEHSVRAAAYTGHAVSYGDPRFAGLQQQGALPGHAVILANGQPVLIPMEYQPQPPPPQQHHYACQPNDVSAIPSFKPSDPPARVCLSERAVVELATAQQQQQLLQQQLQQQQQQSTHHAPPGAAQAPPGPAAASGPGSPSHFMKGAIIQLATGELKRVEDLQTQDFVRSAEVSGGLKIDSSMVVDIRASQQKAGLVALHFTVGEQQSKVTIDVPPEHPFFVFGQGWSSCTPERTAQLYGLACHHLQVGDVCVSITLQQQVQAQPPPPPKQPQQHHHPQLLQQQQQQQQQGLARTPSKASTGPSPQPMGPPAPQQPRLQAQFRIERMYREQDREKEAPGAEGVAPSRPSVPSPSAEHGRSQSSSFHLHTEGPAAQGPSAVLLGAAQAGLSAAQRRWSAPGLQRCVIKGGEGPHAQTRPSFVPQEVKLSIEGRSNAGK
ncbi:unnamed protein product [Gadus morhua 'NCC']